MVNMQLVTCPASSTLVAVPTPYLRFYSFPFRAIVGYFTALPKWIERAESAIHPVTASSLGFTYFSGYLRALRWAYSTPVIKGSRDLGKHFPRLLLSIFIANPLESDGIGAPAPINVKIVHPVPKVSVADADFFGYFLNAKFANVIHFFKKLFDWLAELLLDFLLSLSSFVGNTALPTATKRSRSMTNFYFKWLAANGTIFSHPIPPLKNWLSGCARIMASPRTIPALAINRRGGRYPKFLSAMFTNTLNFHVYPKTVHPVQQVGIVVEAIRAKRDAYETKIRLTAMPQRLDYTTYD